ncbi:MAG: DUF1501 domain-containing protein [Chloroflexi bacterium]|nr:MAG: hypothetical protein UZ13_02300 [Chloroflexi bacterium OLB13]MBV6438209.1 hypothetical protein [Anaerolineae bacterium]MCC6567332.1 DUF1501 domain-containing protein [Chloroflexota bacterium]MBW7880841.1 DUF1501 domain-containing protein [Anaerolineae bacterium]MCO6444318.1 DUF1501 domain-containing protein [Anaerolineae bacterium]
MTTRREFLKTMSVGVIGLSPALFPRWTPRMAFAPSSQVAGQRDILVSIFLRGGMDGLSAVIPFGEGGRYYDRRPSIAIREPGAGAGAAVDLDGFFGLHPSLAPLKDVWDAGALTILHAAGSPDPSRSHFDAMGTMERGTPGIKTTPSGWINRHLQTAAWQNDSPFRAIGMGAMLQSSLRGPVSTFSLSSITDFHLNGREDQAAAMAATLSSLYQIAAPTQAIHQHAASVFASMDVLNQLNPDQYQPANGAAYPDSEFGEALKQVALLIKSDLGLEVACVDLGGWDTHEGQGAADGWFAGLVDDLGRGLQAFYTDLYDLMANITVVTMSEFGRRLEENASGGTDHGHGNVMFVMGGGAVSTVYADWPTLASDALDDGDLAVTTDYRDILSEILVNRLGSDQIETVFPGHLATLPGLIQPRG